MAERRPPHRPTVLDVHRMSDTEMEMSEQFTPDEEYFTPATTAAATTTHSIPIVVVGRGPSVYSQYPYQPRTLKAHNQARETILPLFPPRSTLISMIQQRITTPIVVGPTTDDPQTRNEEVDLLLCNVPKKDLTLEQYQRRQAKAYIPLFELRPWDEIKRKKNYQSFMVSFYNHMYLKLSERWHIDLPILDYNLARLRQCEIKNGLEFSFNDLPVVLEFFLQMDVDLFHLKTCSFRLGQPLPQGIFASDEQSIEGRYGLTPCHQNNCLCCKHKSSFLQFPAKQIHCFLNQYKVVLNCPVTCTTSNIIYALTCPCGSKDYVAYTNLPFADCLSYHRREIVRIICEFLLGDINVNLIYLQAKSQETEVNDQNWLYQHAARCPAVLQLFLDRNPLYWCFVPIPKEPSLRASVYARPRSVSPSAQITTTTGTLPMERRSDTLSMRLANNIPTPTGDYVFTHEQFNNQKLFFKYGKDHDPINMHHLHFYHATIVTVLPDYCSETAKNFITSLLITHGECQLNQAGRLINQQFFHGFPARGHWFRGLTGRPSSAITF